MIGIDIFANLIFNFSSITVANKHCDRKRQWSLSYKNLESLFKNIMCFAIFHYFFRAVPFVSSCILKKKNPLYYIRYTDFKLSQNKFFNETWKDIWIIMWFTNKQFWEGNAECLPLFST